MKEEERIAGEEGREMQPVISPELAMLYAAQGLDEKLQPDPDLVATPIAWKRVHSIPDFVAFDHRPHVAADVACQSCHGPIETMERVRQESDLSMGWCVNCHRSQGLEPAMGTSPDGARLATPDHVSTDCAVCHY